MVEKSHLFILDIDNVLNTEEHLGRVQEQAGYENQDEFKEYFKKHPDEFLEKKRVQRLDELLDALDPEPYIVSCSSWQRYPDMTKKALTENGFTHQIHDRTHNYFWKLSSTRLIEVRSVIQEVDPNRLVILDDSSVYQNPHRDDKEYSFTANHVQPDDGVTDDHAEAIRELWDKPFEFKNAPSGIVEVNEESSML